MIHTELIKNRFDSLEAYEKFALEWAEVCCKVSKSSRNRAEKERFEKAKRVRDMER